MDAPSNGPKEGPHSMKKIRTLIQAIVTHLVGELEFREDFEPPQGEVSQ